MTKLTTEITIEELQYRIHAHENDLTQMWTADYFLNVQKELLALKQAAKNPVAYRNKLTGRFFTLDKQSDASTDAGVYEPVFLAAPAQPVIPEQQQPIAYIFKHPAGRLFWSLTDESNQGQADVIPVYADPHELKIPPAIEPDYEVIKGILPTANPDEYACCIAADMWNACRAEMLKAQPVSEPYKLPDNLDFDCEFENGDYDIDEEPWLRGRVDGFNEALQIIKRSLNAKQNPTAQESE